MEYSWSCVIIYVREYWVIIQVREREKHGRHHEYRLSKFISSTNPPSLLAFYKHVLWNKAYLTF